MDVRFGISVFGNCQLASLTACVDAQRHLHPGLLESIFRYCTDDNLITRMVSQDQAMGDPRVLGPIDYLQGQYCICPGKHPQLASRRAQFRTTPQHQHHYYHHQLRSLLPNILIIFRTGGMCYLIHMGGKKLYQAFGCAYTRTLCQRRTFGYIYLWRKSCK